MSRLNPIAAAFKLHVRCSNCTKDTFQRLEVPDVDDAPRDVEQLMESALLRRQVFACRKCQNPIGQLVAVTQVRVSLEAQS